MSKATFENTQKLQTTCPTSKINAHKLQLLHTISEGSAVEKNLLKDSCTSAFSRPYLFSREKTQQGCFTGFLLPLLCSPRLHRAFMDRAAAIPPQVWWTEQLFPLPVSPHQIRWLLGLPGASQPSRVQANTTPLQELLKGTHIPPQSCLYDGREALCHCPHIAYSRAWSSLGHSRWQGLCGVGTASGDSVKGRRGRSIHIPMVRSTWCHFWVKCEVTELKSVSMCKNRKFFS